MASRAVKFVDSAFGNVDLLGTDPQLNYSKNIKEHAVLSFHSPTIPSPGFYWAASEQDY
jgi:hypothetical protein